MSISPSKRGNKARAFLAASAVAALAASTLVPGAAFADPATPPTVPAPIECVDVTPAGTDTTVEHQIRCGDAFYSFHKEQVVGEGDDTTIIAAHAVLESIAPIDVPGEQTEVTPTYPTSFEVPGTVAYTIPGDDTAPTTWDVTAVADNAFNPLGGTRQQPDNFLRDLTSITFAEDAMITKIGDRAFQGVGVSSFTMPASLREIGVHSFADTVNMTMIDWGESELSTIARFAFSGAGLTELEIPATVKSLQRDAFSHNKSLHQVTFEDDSQLEEVGEAAFYSTPLKGTLVLPDTVHTLGPLAFWNQYNKLDVVTMPFVPTEEQGLAFARNAFPWVRHLVVVDTAEAAYRDALTGAEHTPWIHAVSTTDASLLLGRLYWSATDTGSDRTVLARHASKELFLQPQDDPIHALGLGFIGGSMDMPSYSEDLVDGSQVTITALDGVTTETWTIRFSATPAPDAERHAGKSRFETSCALTADFIADKAGEWGANAQRPFIVTSGRSITDASAAAAAGGQTDLPVLHVDTNELPECAEALLADHALGVILIGGTSAISQDVEDDIRALLEGDRSTYRLAGKDRVETANLITRVFWQVPVTGGHTTAALRGATELVAPHVTTTNQVVIANAHAHSDMVTGASGASMDGIPVLSIPEGATSLPDSVADLLDDMRESTGSVPQATILGGKLAVSAQVERALNVKLGTRNVSRVAGHDRFETSALFAKEMADRSGIGFDHVTLANGRTHSDAAAATPYASHNESHVLLSESHCIPSSAHELVLGSNGYRVLGGSAAMTDAIDVDVTRCGGPVTDPTPPPTI